MTLGRVCLYVITSGSVHVTEAGEGSSLVVWTARGSGRQGQGRQESGVL